MNRLPLAFGAFVVWVALAVAPAYLVGTGAIGTLYPDGDISGTAILTWFVGYLISLGWLYVVGLAAGHSQHWWFFGGSILPWIIDFTAAFSPRGALPVTAVIVGHGVAMAWLVFHVARAQAGTPVTAKVVKVLPPFLHMNMVVNNVYLHRRILVEVPRPDGTTYQAKVGVLTEMGDSPSPGDPLAVLVDPQHPSRVVVAPSALS
jgi:hypothetical protein